MTHHHETRLRSFLKAATWWTVVFLLDIAVIFFLTHEIGTTILAVVLTNGLGAAIYFFHERIWSKIFFGLRAHRPTDAD